MKKGEPPPPDYEVINREWNEDGEYSFTFVMTFPPPGPFTEIEE